MNTKPHIFVSGSLATKKRFRILDKIRGFEKYIFSKRYRFIVGVLFLTILLFFSEQVLGRSGIYFAFILALLADVVLLLANLKDIRENPSPFIFILPFFYTLSAGLFYFVLPPRFIIRILVFVVYGIGLYSLFLSENIFIVASMRTIALLSSARIVAMVVTILSYIALCYIVFSLHLFPALTAVIVFIISFLLILQALWTITLEKSIKSYSIWSLSLSVCLTEIALLLSFWPDNWIISGKPIFIAGFLTGWFYILVGISQIWLDRRLFKGVMREYIWFSIFLIALFLFFTSWQA